MSMSNAAQLADLVTALAVICSLFFVAVEFRRSNTLRRYQNSSTVRQGMQEFRSRAQNPALAPIIATGREDYVGLSASDKIVFGAYMEECVQTIMSPLLFRDVLAIKEAGGIALAHLRFQFGFPGVREWWREYHETRLFPTAITAEIEGIISATVKSGA